MVYKGGQRLVLWARGGGGHAPTLDAVPAGNGVLVEVRLQLRDRHARQVFLLRQTGVVSSEPCKPGWGGA